MKTAHTDAAELTAKLTKMGFVPARWDEANFRQLQILNKDGHANLRVCIDYQGESKPHLLTLIKYDGRRSQVTAWESNGMSAHMPLAATLALIKACI